MTALHTASHDGATSGDWRACSEASGDASPHMAGTPSAHIVNAAVVAQNRNGLAKVGSTRLSAEKARRTRKGL